MFMLKDLEIFLLVAACLNGKHYKNSIYALIQEHCCFGKKLYSMFEDGNTRQLSGGILFHIQINTTYNNTLFWLPVRSGILALTFLLPQNTMCDLCHPSSLCLLVFVLLPSLFVSYQNQQENKGTERNRKAWHHSRHYHATTQNMHCISCFLKLWWILSPWPENVSGICNSN